MSHHAVGLRFGPGDLNLYLIQDSPVVGYTGTSVVTTRQVKVVRELNGS